GERPDRLAVLANVRYQHDAGKDLGVTLRKEFRGAPRHALLAEIAGDPDQVFLRELLARENDDDMVEPSLIDRFDRVLIGLLTQTEAADLRADMLAERNDLEPGLCRHVHWRFSRRWASIELIRKTNKAIAFSQPGPSVASAADSGRVDRVKAAALIRRA